MGTESGCQRLKMMKAILVLFAVVAVSADIGALLNIPKQSKFSAEGAAMAQFKDQRGHFAEMLEGATATMEAGRRLAMQHSDDVMTVAKAVPEFKKASELFAE